MLRADVTSWIQTAIEALVASGALPSVDGPPVAVDDPKNPDHGDFATNWAMAAAKPIAAAGGPQNPRALGELLAASLRSDPRFESVDVAGPGFVNLRLAPDACARVLTDVLERSTGSVLDDPGHFGRPNGTRPERINVEFVSVNPNGPITIGSGRGAAFGSTLANVLAAAGHTVHREYYINDGVNSEQMRQFAESVKAICEGRPVPEKGYKGDYVADVAKQVADLLAQGDGSVVWFQDRSQDFMLQKQRSDLEAFGVTFDTWFSEQSLHDSGKVQEHLAALTEVGVADEGAFRTKLKTAKGGVVEEAVREPQGTGVEDEDEGEGQPGSPEDAQCSTLWLRSTKFGDDMDRVLRRRDGRLTYIASDVAYHADKFNRPVDADRLITVLGPDHHGYIGRLHAVVAAVLSEERPRGDVSVGTPLSDWEQVVYASEGERDACRSALSESRRRLEVLIFQLVRFMKDGRPAPMRKRDGNVYALIDLMTEIGQKVKPGAVPTEQLRAGCDVARFFYLMRHHDTTFDFDLDLAERQSDENPVFYVQYAHARICSVMDRGREAGIEVPDDPVLPADKGLHGKERALILKIADLPYETGRCAEDYAVSRLTTYAVELARTYHHFYEACLVVDLEDRETSEWRLALCAATRSALKATFDLLGISAPERMARVEA
ncbi:MAG: arginine--tRNA ligase [Armatimonadetes bacterium]|nr:arginine--tRNA ligase [Armatimonadota bacterium]